MSNDDFSSTSVEMDVYETAIQKNDENRFHTGMAVDYIVSLVSCVVYI